MQKKKVISFYQRYIYGQKYKGDKADLYNLIDCAVSNAVKDTNRTLKIKNNLLSMCLNIYAQEELKKEIEKLLKEGYVCIDYYNKKEKCKNFDEWHDTISKKLINIFKEKVISNNEKKELFEPVKNKYSEDEKIKKKMQFDEFNKLIYQSNKRSGFEHAHAQKWINMTIKYFFSFYLLDKKLF